MKCYGEMNAEAPGNFIGDHEPKIDFDKLLKAHEADTELLKAQGCAAESQASDQRSWLYLYLCGWYLKYNDRCRYSVALRHRGRD